LIEEGLEHILAEACLERVGIDCKRLKSAVGKHCTRGKMDMLYAEGWSEFQ
jgi:hypothetical protein